MTVIRASLRTLIAADADPIENYRPSGAFGISIMALIGPSDGPGEESFQFTVCTPEWFKEQYLSEPEAIASGRHFLFVNAFDYAVLVEFVRDYCASCDGETWGQVAEKLGRFGLWEFEDYGLFKG